MDISAYIDIPILFLVYLIMEFSKKVFLKDDKERSLIPIIALFVGSVISVVIFYVWPEISSSVNPFSAFASGGISGAAATGGNQIYKQIHRFFTMDTENE